MTYTIVSSDGNFTIAPQDLDTTDTPLALPGKDYSGWGQYYTQNLVNLLENFASAPPSNPRTGMIWYNAATQALELYSNDVWSNISGGPASKLATPVTISLSGMATGSVSFDGSTSVAIPVTLQATGVTPGTYTNATVQIDSYGRVVSASSGYESNANVTEVNSFNGRIGTVTFMASDVDGALGYTPVSPATLSAYATTAALSAYQLNLGYTPVNRAGDSMSGTLNLAGNPIIGLPTPINPNDGVPKNYVDTVSSSRTQRIFNGSGETSYNVTVSPNQPSGGSDGDVWYVY